MVIRQARIFLAGGVSGTALIVTAIVAFMLLVSLQALRDWPLSGLGGDGGGAVQDRSPVASQGGPHGPVVAGAPAAGVEAPVNRGRSGDGAVAGGDAPGSPGAGQPVAKAPSSSPAAGPAGPARSDGRGNSTAGGGPAPPHGGGSPSLSQTATDTVNETVSGVDTATGGALGNAGVTATAEDAVNGAAGPKSTLGGAADSATEAVDGLPGADR